ncbi:MAG TPA: hypothetical protein VIG24_11560 [Acidimicrobiia bacterium]
MEYQVTPEAVLREEIALLREQETRLKQRLGAVEEERRRREAEWMMVRGDELVAQRVDDDWE